MKYFFIEFEVTDKKRFALLARIFAELKRDKDAGSFRSDEEWLQLFDEESLSHFWRPSAEEREAYWRLFWQTPVAERFDDPRLQVPWDFSSMIDAFKNGEYELVSCRMVSEDRARLEYNPSAGPFGGTGCMRALIEAFGFRVVRDYWEEPF